MSAQPIQPEDDTTMGVIVTAEWLAALGEALREMGERLDVLPQLAADLAEIKRKVDEYEPLIDMVKKRADRGSVWRRGRQEGE